MHRFLSLSTVKKYEPLAKASGVSKVARSPDAWLSKREAFISRHMAQMKDERKFIDGKPTRRHLALIMWAYSPVPGRL